MPILGLLSRVFLSPESQLDREVCREEKRMEKKSLEGAGWTGRRKSRRGNAAAPGPRARSAGATPSPSRPADARRRSCRPRTISRSPGVGERDPVTTRDLDRRESDADSLGRTTYARDFGSPLCGRRCSLPLSLLLLDDSYTRHRVVVRAFLSVSDDASTTTTTRPSQTRLASKVARKTRARWGSVNVPARDRLSPYEQSSEMDSCAPTSLNRFAGVVSDTPTSLESREREREREFPVPCEYRNTMERVSHKNPASTCANQRPRLAR